MRFITFGFLAIVLIINQSIIADNQTATVSPIFPEDSLPFTISIEEQSFNLPSGLHSGASANYEGQWIILAGRTNGLHGFAATDNFPPSFQNTVAYVIDWEKQTVYSRDLNDSSSGLSQQQIDQLSVTSPQFFQHGKTLYICGGYGVDTYTGDFSTKTTLTAINLRKFVKWIKQGKGSAASAIRQTSDPLLQVTGGDMRIVNNHLQALLIFGQNFTGQYTDSSNGNYTKQVRRFQIIDTGKELYVQSRSSEKPDPNYRRRDLNVVPIIHNNRPAFVALSGVFTDSAGIWTVPVLINTNGSTSMANPNAPSTFKQGMNNYISATAGLYSKSTKDMYITIFGGISFGYFSGSVFTTDSEFPFINQLTTVKMDKDNNFTQYLMDNEYPVILSTGSNPGNQLIFGAGAIFFANENLPAYSNGVFDLDDITKPTVLGYIVGGIMSTLPNTNTITDSTASPYIFPVVLTPR